MNQGGMDPMMMMIPMAGCMVCVIGAILYYTLVMKPQQEKDTAAKAAADAAAAAAAVATSQTTAPAYTLTGGGYGSTGDAVSGGSGGGGSGGGAASTTGLADWLSQGGSVGWSTGTISSTNKPSGTGTPAPFLEGGNSSAKNRILGQKSYLIIEGANAVSPSSKCTNPKMSKNTNQSAQVWNVVPYTGPGGTKAYKITSASSGCARAITAPTCTGGATLEVPANKTTQMWNLVYAGAGNKTIFRNAACTTNGFLRSGTTGAMGMGTSGTTFVAKPYASKKKSKK